MNHKNCLLIILLAVCLLPASAYGHFIWLDTTASDGKVEVYFSESAAPGEAELLKLIAAAKVWKVSQDGKAESLNLSLTDESLSANIKDNNGLFVLAHDYGVFSRGDKAMHLKYFAKAGPALGESAWNAKTGKQLDFDILPSFDGDKVKLTVYWQGKPLEGAEVTIDGQSLKTVEAKTDKKGQTTFTPAEAGFHYIRAKYVIDKPGEHNGKKYDSKRHYVTLTLNIDPAAATRAQPAAKLPDIPRPVTSFGGAIIGDDVYIYGGHEGEAHEYYAEGQSKSLWRLNLSGTPKWKELSKGPSLQGLAMVAHNGKLYRMGGFTAKNPQGEDQDLWSRPTVECFDPATGKWTSLPDLPEPRSSFDAAVDEEGKIYVIGGWQMSGDQGKVWHKTAYVLDSTQKNPQWQPLPEPPFQRRALSVAVFNDKVYAIGGMQQKRGPTTRVDVLDTKTGKWSQGPALPGKGMDGFGSSAFATGSKLYVSSYSGTLYRLSNDGSEWTKVKVLKRDRFFHRMLPVSPNALLMVGGASMTSGKFAEVDIVPVN